MEVVDGWLVKLYPKVPTWGDIADVVEKIGHSNLAQSIRQVYTTGEPNRTVSYVKWNKHEQFGKVFRDAGKVV